MPTPPYLILPHEIMGYVQDHMDVHGDFKVGETIRHNHSKCPEGTDTRRRLYITHKLDGGTSLYLAYCHNCQGSGVRSVGRLYPISHTLADPAAPKDPDAPIEVPEDCVPMDDPDVPVEAVRWLTQYRMPLTNGLTLWSPVNQRIVIQCFCPEDDELLGYQMRRIPGGYGPKYITVAGRGPLEWDYAGSREGCVAAVFTEDAISAWRINNACCGHTVAFPLFGLNVRPEYIVRILTKTTPKATPIIWFDNDGPDKHAKEYLASLCAAIGRPAGRVPRTWREAKYYSDEEINNVINTFIIP